jgi:hypothetical protein
VEAFVMPLANISGYSPIIRFEESEDQVIILLGFLLKFH